MIADNGTNDGVDGQSRDERWPSADAVAAVGGPVRELTTDSGYISEADIKQRLARLE